MPADSDGRAYAAGALGTGNPQRRHILSIQRRIIGNMFGLECRGQNLKIPDDLITQAYQGIIKYKQIFKI